MTNSMRWLVFAAFLFLIPSLAQGQNEKVIHQAFDLNGIDHLSVDLAGAVEIEFWAGDNALSETKIQLYDAPGHVLKFFIEEKKRYEILEARNETSLRLSSNDPVRDPIRYRETTCFESVKLRLFIPDSFEKTGEGEYQRR
ncbi:MAG: hypothetical protein WA004_11920 [Saprospiraceae bacterium]